MSLSLPSGIAIAFLGAGMLLGQQPAAGTRVNAELKTKLATKSAHVGDKVTAVTTSDVKRNGVKIIPKGTTLTGHVTEVTAAESKKSPSHLGVLFDQATTRQGVAIPLRAAIAMIVPDAPPDMNMGGPTPMPMPDNTPLPQGDTDRMPRPGQMDGVGNGNAAAPMPPVTIGQGDTERVVNSDGSAITNGGNREISSVARASNGSPLRIQGSSATGSVISSPQGDISIGSGTRLELVVLGQSSRN